MQNPVVVYIVDDDESVRRGLSRLVRSAGYDPVAFDTVEGFLEAVRNDHTGCILLDITLPRTTGLQLQQQLTEKGIQLPIIVISAREDDEIRNLAFKQGVKFFFHKPVDDCALLDAIAWVLCAKS